MNLLTVVAVIRIRIRIKVIENFREKMRKISFVFRKISHFWCENVLSEKCKTIRNFAKNNSLTLINVWWQIPIFFVKFSHFLFSEKISHFSRANKMLNFRPVIFFRENVKFSRNDFYFSLETLDWPELQIKNLNILTFSLG